MTTITTGAYSMAAGYSTGANAEGGALPGPPVSNGPDANGLDGDIGRWTEPFAFDAGDGVKGYFIPLNTRSGPGAAGAFWAHKLHMIEQEYATMGYSPTEERIQPVGNRIGDSDPIVGGGEITDPKELEEWYRHHPQARQDTKDQSGYIDPHSGAGAGKASLWV